MITTTLLWFTSTMTTHTYKTKNLPPIFVVSLEESTDRRTNLYNQFKKYHIDNFQFCIYKRFAEYSWKLTGMHVDRIDHNSYGPTTSHILTNKYWIENTDYEYALVVEDDIDLSTIDLWNFKWEDLFNSLPEDWDCVQLSIMRENPDDLEFRIKQRYMHDFGCQIYLVKRHYAERMAQLYYRPDGFHLQIPTCWVTHSADEGEWLDLFPLVENLVFEGIGKVYSLPLFCEDLSHIQTTSIGVSIENFRIPCKEKLIEKILDYVF